MKLYTCQPSSCRCRSSLRPASNNSHCHRWLWRCQSSSQDWALLLSHRNKLANVSFFLWYNALHPLPFVRLHQFFPDRHLGDRTSSVRNNIESLMTIDKCVRHGLRRWIPFGHCKAVVCWQQNNTPSPHVPDPLLAEKSGRRTRVELWWFSRSLPLKIVMSTKRGSCVNEQHFPLCVSNFPFVNKAFIWKRNLSSRKSSSHWIQNPWTLFGRAATNQHSWANSTNVAPLSWVYSDCLSAGF